MIIEVWESQDGAAADILYAPEQNPTRPIKVSLLSEENDDTVLFLSVDDFKKLLKAGLRFDEQVSGILKRETLEHEWTAEEWEALPEAPPLVPRTQGLPMSTARERAKKRKEQAE